MTTKEKTMQPDALTEAITAARRGFTLSIISLVFALAALLASACAVRAQTTAPPAPATPTPQADTVSKDDLIELLKGQVSVLTSQRDAASSDARSMYERERQRVTELQYQQLVQTIQGRYPKTIMNPATGALSRFEAAGPAPTPPPSPPPPATQPGPAQQPQATAPATAGGPAK